MKNMFIFYAFVCFDRTKTGILIWHSYLFLALEFKLAHSKMFVMSPMKVLLMIQQRHVLWVDKFITKLFFLQELQKVEAVRITDKLDILWLSPIIQIFQVPYETGVGKVF
mmetsp:Transcript_17302/g.28648  ORF Transcript_17302/g.28648 Transcript_17302/m.28648 type:complete len:110 (-) Transcript_17302:375-704(-)